MKKFAEQILRYRSMDAWKRQTTSFRL